MTTTTTDTTTTMSPVDWARTRVDESDTLGQYSDLLLGDWPEGDEHYEWVATAPESALIDWAQHIRDAEHSNEFEDWERTMNNYPPGVSGAEPEIVGSDDEDETMTWSEARDFLDEYMEAFVLGDWSMLDGETAESIISNSREIDIEWPVSAEQMQRWLDARALGQEA